MKLLTEADEEVVGAELDKAAISAVIHPVGAVERLQSPWKKDAGGN